MCKFTRFCSRCKVDSNRERTRIPVLLCVILDHLRFPCANKLVIGLGGEELFIHP